MPLRIFLFQIEKLRRSSRVVSSCRISLWIFTFHPFYYLSVHLGWLFVNTSHYSQIILQITLKAALRREQNLRRWKGESFSNIICIIHVLHVVYILCKFSIPTCTLTLNYKMLAQIEIIANFSKLLKESWMSPLRRGVSLFPGLETAGSLCIFYAITSCKIAG